MTADKTILLVNDYGIYPELTKALGASKFALKTEHLMRKAIKELKKNPPHLLIAEFFHEPQFRDRVSNLESILSQIQRNQHKSKTLILVYPEHEQWVPEIEKLFQLDAVLSNQASVESIMATVTELLEN